MPIILRLPEQLEFKPDEFIKYVEEEVFPHRKDLHLVISGVEICFYHNPGLFAAEILANNPLLLEGLAVDVLGVSNDSLEQSRLHIPEDQRQEFFEKWTKVPCSITVNGVDIEQNHWCCWWLIRTLLSTNRVDFEETLDLFQKIGRAIPHSDSLALNLIDRAFLSSCPELVEQYLQKEAISIVIIVV